MSSQRWPLAKTWRLGVGAVRVPDAEGDLDGLGVDEGRAAGQRDAADPRGCGGEGAQRAGEVLHIMPRRHVAGVACFQLVVQALHQLILGSGGIYTHFDSYGEGKLFFQSVHRCTDEKNSVLWRKTVQKSCPYIDVQTRVIAFCSPKPCKNRATKTLPEESSILFFYAASMSRASWSKLGGGRLRRDCPELELARGLGQGHGVQAPGEGARRVGLRLDTEAGLRGGAAACGAAGRAAAGAQREVLRLSGVVHAVGGPDVLHGRVLAALLGPEERVLQHPARAAREAVGCAARNAHGQPQK